MKSFYRLHLWGYLMSEKHPGGRPTLYRPEYCQKMIDYFNRPLTKKENNKIVGNELPQITGFAQELGVSRQTLLDWTKAHPEFLDAYNHCLSLQEQMIVGNSINNRYNAYFAQFMLKNCHGWKDKTEVEQRTQTIEIDDKDKQL